MKFTAQSHIFMVAGPLTASGQFFQRSWKDLFPEMVQRIPSLEALMEKPRHEPGAPLRG